MYCVPLKLSSMIKSIQSVESDIKPRGRFHEKSQTEPDSRLSQGLKSETFVSAEFLAQMDFTKGGSAETSLKLWSQLFNLISYI